MDFEKLLSDFEYENQDYVRQIEKEKQNIEVLEKEMTTLQNDLLHEAEVSPQLDEDTKRFHKQFTNNRDNIESLQRTLKLMANHEEALAAQIKNQKLKREEENKQRQDVVDHYGSIWSDYKKTYDRFPLAQKLHTLNDEKKIIEKQHKEETALMDELSNKLQELQLAQATKLEILSIESKATQEWKTCLALKKQIDEFTKALQLKQEEEHLRQELEKTRKEEEQRRQVEEERIIKETEKRGEEERKRLEEAAKIQEESRKEQEQPRKLAEERVSNRGPSEIPSLLSAASHGAVPSLRFKSLKPSPQLTMPPPPLRPLVAPQSRMTTCVTPKLKSPPKVSKYTPTQVAPSTPLLSIPTSRKHSAHQAIPASTSPVYHHVRFPQLTVHTPTIPAPMNPPNISPVQNLPPRLLAHLSPAAHVPVLRGQPEASQSHMTSTVSVSETSPVPSLSPPTNTSEASPQVTNPEKVSQDASPARPASQSSAGHSPFDLEKQLSVMKGLTSTKSPSSDFLYNSRVMFHNRGSPLNEGSESERQFGFSMSSFPPFFGAEDGVPDTEKLDGITSLTSDNGAGDATFTFPPSSDSSTQPGTDNPFSFSTSNTPVSSQTSFSFTGDMGGDKSQAGGGLFGMFSGGGVDKNDLESDAGGAFSFTFGSEVDSPAAQPSTFTLF